MTIDSMFVLLSLLVSQVIAASTSTSDSDPSTSSAGLTTTSTASYSPSTSTNPSATSDPSSTNVSSNNTRQVKFQLNYNTSRCLSAILDSEGYAQPELTLIQNCTYSTNWTVPLDFDAKPGEVMCGECVDQPVLEGGRWGNQTNATVLAARDERSLGQRWMIGLDQRISVRTSSEPDIARYCLGETVDGEGDFYVRTEYCGDGPDSEGSKINQIWNLIEL